VPIRPSFESTWGSNIADRSAKGGESPWSAIMLKAGVAVTYDRRRGDTVLVYDRIWRLRSTASALHQEAMRRLAAGSTTDEMAALLGARRAERLIQTLMAAGLLRNRFINEFTGTAQERQIEYLADLTTNPNEAQRALASATVCIIGCGGTGFVALQHVLGAGVRRLVLIDPDCVGLENFNRQFVPSRLDLGRPKVAVAMEYARGREPESDIITAQRRIEQPSDLAAVMDGLSCNLVIGCADAPPGRIEAIIVEYCLEHCTPCVFSGVGVRFGTVGPLLVEPQPMGGYLDDLRRMLGDCELSAPPSASFGPTNTLIATLMMRDALHFLAGLSSISILNTQWCYRFLEHKYEVVRSW